MAIGTKLTDKQKRLLEERAEEDKSVLEYFIEFLKALLIMAIAFGAGYLGGFIHKLILGN